MSERKLYLAGIGGNRYETTLEELKKQAFEGKIKRKDKIIVNEVVDGQAREYVVLCEKVKEFLYPRRDSASHGKTSDRSGKGSRKTRS